MPEETVLERTLILGLLLVACAASIPLADAKIEFSSKFGERGSGDAQLDDPVDLTVESNGRKVYVVDKNNDRINVFVTGTPDARFGTLCDTTKISQCSSGVTGASENGDGQFNKPTSIGPNGAGDLAIVDAGNERVQIMDNSKFVSKFGTADTKHESYFEQANGIVAQFSTKDLYISETVKDTILVFDSKGTFKHKFDTYDKDKKFKDPAHMAIDTRDEMLYVADSGNNKIVIFELVSGSSCPSGTEKVVDGVCYVDSFGSEGTDDAKFKDPTGLAYDEDEDLLYVSDSGNDRIQSFKMSGSEACSRGTTKVVDGVCFVEKFGSKGSGDGEFDNPLGIAFDKVNKLLYVADSENDRVQALKATSEPKEKTPDKPRKATAAPASPSSIIVTWDAAEQHETIPAVTGYKIEYKVDDGDITTATDDTKSPVTAFIHKGLEEGKTYYYRISAINSEGTSDATSLVSAKPDHTTTPSALTAAATSPTEVKLSWVAPSQTFGMQIGEYEVKREVGLGVYDTVATTSDTSYTVTGLETGETYTYAVTARMGVISTDESNTASATPMDDSKDAGSGVFELTSVSDSATMAPRNLKAVSESPTEVKLTWDEPETSNVPDITGYKIESNKDGAGYTTIQEDTKSTDRTYTHTSLETGSTYAYRVYAINSAGASEASSEATATPKIDPITIKSIGKINAEAGKELKFTASLTDSSVTDHTFRLVGAPSGAKITENTGRFTWTPASSDAGKTITFDIEAKKLSSTDKETVTVTVKEPAAPTPAPTPDPVPPREQAPPKEQPPAPSKLAVPAPFVEAGSDPQSYVDRYKDEPTFKAWFDENYKQYDSIYHAVGLDEPVELAVPAPFVEAGTDPQSYVDRYNSESSYKSWFDENYAAYDSIYHAVGLDEPAPDAMPGPGGAAKEPGKKYGFCGEGTRLVDGVCVLDRTAEPARAWWMFW